MGDGGQGEAHGGPGEDDCCDAHTVEIGEWSFIGAHGDEGSDEVDEDVAGL